MTINEKLEFLARNGALAAQIAATTHPAARQLGSVLLDDLLAWRVENGLADELEEGRKQLMDARDFRKQEAKERMRREGPGLWGEWHKRALAMDDSHAGQPYSPEEIQAENAWLNVFVARIPCGDCRNHFRALLADYFRNGFENYFKKTVGIHNIVSERVNKEEGTFFTPVMTVDEARQVWSVQLQS